MTAQEVFLIRHGETEWSLNGRHTGISALCVGEEGAEQRAPATTALRCDESKGHWTSRTEDGVEPICCMPFVQPILKLELPVKVTVSATS